MTPLPITEQDRKIFNTSKFDGDMSFNEFRNTSWTHLFVFNPAGWDNCRHKFNRLGNINRLHFIMYSVDSQWVLVWIKTYNQFHTRNKRLGGQYFDNLPTILIYSASYIIYLDEFKDYTPITAKYIKDRNGLAEKMTTKQQLRRFHQELNTYTRLR